MSSSAVVDIRNSFGAAFIGLVVSTTLLGLTISQTWIYFWNYHNRDSKAFKFFIAFITFMDALHTSFCAYAVYWYLILNFDNVENLGSSMWAMNIQAIFGIVISASVEFYYAIRVYKLSQNIICPIIIVALFATGATLGLLFAIKEIILKQFSSFHTLIWIPYAGLTAGALSELLVTVAMCWSLYHKRTGFARTDSIINTLMAYTINSGFLTSVLGIAATIAFVISPSSLISAAIFWTMCKFSVNSLLALLNSRDRVCYQSTTGSPDTGSMFCQHGLSVTVHRSTTSNFRPSKSDHGVETTFEIPQLDPGIFPFQGQGQASPSSV